MDNLFFRNRRLLVLSIALIIVAGLSSFTILPRLEDPELRRRAAIITTRFPGANAERVESLVTEKIEKALEEIDELRLVRSNSRNEFSSITMELEDFVSGPVDEIWSRVRDKVSDVTPSLPQEASTPEFENMPFKAYAILVAVKWTHQSNTNYAILRRQAERLEDNLRNLFGTEEVDLFGDPDEEIAIEIDHAKLTALALTPQDVANAINRADAKISSGGLRSETNEMVVEVDSEFQTIESILETPLRAGELGGTIRLTDVARVKKGIKTPFSTRTLVEDCDAIVLGAFVQSHLRIDQWNTEAQKALDEYESTLPSGIELDRMFTQADYVDARFDTLLNNLGLGALAVTLVIFLMMGWRSAIVVGLALPFVGAMVVAGLRYYEVPMHQMSVTGLIIALGLLIDNAIVIVDETRNRLREGLSPADAVAKSVRHLAIPLFGSTFTTALAFAPLILMPGPAGEFVGGIGLSVILAVTGSLFVSLTIIPSIFAIIAKVKPATEEEQPIEGFWQNGIGFGWLYRGYRKTLGFVFRYPIIAVLFGLFLPVVGFIQASNLPEQFFPPSDRDQIKMTLVMPAQASIEQTTIAARAARKLALEHPQVERVDWFIGESSPAFYYNMLPLRNNQPNYAQAFVQLKNDENVFQTVNELQDQIEREVTQATVLVQQLEQGPPVDAPILVRVFGHDLVTLRNAGETLRLHMSELDHVVVSQSETSNVNAKYLLDVDQEAARLAGLTHDTIARQLNSSLDGLVGGSMLEGTEELPVRIKLTGEQRTDPEQLASLDIIAGQPEFGNTQRIPISAIGDWKLVPNNATIERLNGIRFNEVQVNVKAGILPSEVLGKFKQKLDETNFELPAGYTLDVAGESAERDRAVGQLLGSAGILMVLMAAGLVLSFQSFRIAAQIGLVAVLSVGIGIAALWFFGKPFGFTAIVGIMGLVGVAINDSIVVLAALQENKDARRGDSSAVAQVVFHSTRHVLSTTLTTIAGFLPLIYSGGGFWPPLAIAVAGGVTGATILALYFVPATYMLMMRIKQPATAEEGDSAVVATA
jgi:multidrug efflux pump subunit AcrB